MVLSESVHRRQQPDQHIVQNVPLVCHLDKHAVGAWRFDRHRYVQVLVFKEALHLPTGPISEIWDLEAISEGSLCG